jgi:hypothetical protein
LFYDLPIIYRALDYLQVDPGPVISEVQSSDLLILECFVLGLDDNILLEVNVLCLLFVIFFVSCYFVYFKNNFKKVTRLHGLGLTDPNALLTKNDSGIILFNSYLQTKIHQMLRRY